MGVGSWKWEVGSWKSEVGSGKWEVGSGKLGVGSWKLGVGSWNLGVDSEKLMGVIGWYFVFDRSNHGFGTADWHKFLVHIHFKL